jgi:hypothetical protein
MHTLSDVLQVVGTGNTITKRTYVVIGFWWCAGHRVVEEEILRSHFKITWFVTDIYTPTA